MSGICGWVVTEPGEPETPSTGGRLEAMMEAASFRGPAGRASWCVPGAALGHLALAVTPEPTSEEQPVVDREADLAVVADARLDNREELLSRLGVGEERSRCGDATLILAAYRRWGTACPDHLVGDFAFAVWNGRERSLFAARDPMGMRGLHYRREGGRFLFATEVEQVLAASEGAVEIFEPAMAAFLAGEWGPPDWTFFRGVTRLPPGHALLVTQGGPRTWRYWDLDPAERIRYRRHEEYVEHFRELLTEAVRTRLRSRGPVGIFLSGGVDSGSVAATAGWFRRRNGGSTPELRAYSFAFHELAECDERHISGPLAGHFDIPVVDVPADDAWPLRGHPSRGPHRSEPFMFGHQTVLERACQAARRDGVRLVLSGDRGDLVGGMAIYDLPALFRHGRWWSLVRELRTMAGWRGTSVATMARKQLLRPAKRKLVEAAPAFLGRPPSRPRRAIRVPRWVPGAFVERTGLQEAWAPETRTTRGWSLAQRERYEAVFTPLHMTGVACSERMHARHGQSFADPWSDVRLVRFAVAVPQRVLNQVGRDKRLTRAAMRGRVPDSILDEMRKIVPTPLFDRGLRDRARGTVETLLTGMEAARRGWVDESELRREHEAIRAGEGDVSRFWRALCCEIWLRTHELGDTAGRWTHGSP